MFIDEKALAEMQMLRPSGCCCELSAVEAFHKCAARNGRILRMILWIVGAVTFGALLFLGFGI